MVDGTRPPSAAGPELHPLITDEIGARVRHARDEGAALLTLVARWSAATNELISDLEAEIGSGGIADEVFSVVSRLVGLDGLLEIAEGIAEACEPTAPRP